MQILNKNISVLKPYENNPRFNDGAVDAVANSIKEFGFKVPIVIDKNNIIVCGHTRYKACKKLGIEVVPCVVADDLTDEQIKAFRLADNKVGELAEWDFNALAKEIDAIADIDMSQFNFDVDTIRDLASIKMYDDIHNASLQERFIVPPFSTLDTRKNYWQKRMVKFRY